MMILDLHRQGLNLAVIARQVGIDCKTVHKYIARELEAPTYGPRQPRERVLDPWLDYLKVRLAAYPGLSAQRAFYARSASVVTSATAPCAIPSAHCGRSVAAAPLPRFSRRSQGNRLRSTLRSAG